jgi:hypothetical protein
MVENNISQSAELAYPRAVAPFFGGSSIPICISKNRSIGFVRIQQP